MVYMLINKNNNEQEVLPRVPTSIGNGSKNVTPAGTPVQLTATSTPCFYVLISAKPTNTGYIYIGTSNVSATSGMMIAALQPIRIDIDDVSKIYIDADTGGEGVQFTYVAP